MMERQYKILIVDDEPDLAQVIPSEEMSRILSVIPD